MAVVIVDLVQYQRRRDERDDVSMPLRSLHFGPDGGRSRQSSRSSVTRVRLELAVLIPWDVCPLGVLLGRTLDSDRRAGLESRVVKLGHRLANLLGQSRPVLAEVLDVPLIKNEPRPEGDARACPRGEVPAQPAKQTVRIAAPRARPFQMPPAIRIHTPLYPRLVRQQHHVHKAAS